MITRTFVGLAAVCALMLAGCGDAPAPAPAERTPLPADRAAAAPTAPDAATLLDQALAGDHRSEENRARDRWRNPKETLLFFGLDPQMTVIELYPGTGWYTEVLAPVLRDHGKLIAAQFDPDHPPAYRDRVFNEYKAMLGGRGDVFGEVEVLVISDDDISLGDDASADMVVTFRNLHTWIGGGDLEPMFAAAYRVLKPGGVFGVVQHRSEEGVDPTERARTGYVPESFVVEKAREAGFELDERSEINANPLDTKDYDIGVWALPPSLRGQMDMREQRAAIGESDRMTLRFIKPGG